MIVMLPTPGKSGNKPRRPVAWASSIMKCTECQSLDTGVTSHGTHDADLGGSDLRARAMDVVDHY
jgi:hypothetical protein